MNNNLKQLLEEFETCVIDPEILHKFGNENCWKLGQDDIIAETRNTDYHISSDGIITGGRFVNGRNAELWGAVTYLNGPIKIDYVIVGLKIEGNTNDGKKFCSSTVLNIRGV